MIISKKKSLFIAIAFILIQTLYLNLGCSVKNDYNTLSFFFDGIQTPSKIDSTAPKIDEVRKSSLMLADSIPMDTQVYYHKVYNRENCNECHQITAKGLLKNEEPELCYQCHDDFEKKYPKVHGPVGAGFCTSCHEHHKSKYKHLLKIPIQEICQHCHVAGDIEKNLAHRESAEKVCIDCHNSHGGETLNMLKTNGSN